MYLGDNSAGECLQFSVCPIAHPVEDGEGMRIRDLLRVPLFWLTILLMVCAGASELSMAQWASAFAESALGLTKSVGDIAGPCMFAVTMGISRTLYGKYGEKLDLMKFMIGSALLCLTCYITASLSVIPVIGLLGCIMCGFSVGIMWPGSISICSGKYPPAELQCLHSSPWLVILAEHSVPLL